MITADQLNKTLKTENIPFSYLAAWCGVSPVAVWKWRRGKVPVPGYVETILVQRRRIGALQADLAKAAA